MKINGNDFNNISMIGRAAYCVMCVEKYALAKYPEKDWKPLLKWMWQITTENFDEWYYRFMEILPDYLYEFDNYKDSDFEYLSEDDYNYYSEFLKDIDSNMNKLLKITTEISMVYSYTEIPGIGKESIKLVEKAISILNTAGIEPPNVADVSRFSFSEKNGWGNHFDGTTLSVVLNN